MGLDNLLVQLGINTKAYDSGLARAGKLAQGFGSTLKGQLAAAFGTAAIVSWVKHVADAVEKWKDVSEQFGISTDEAQQLEEQAKKSGRSLEEVTGALFKLNQARQAALAGDEKLTRSFSMFGVALKDLASDKSALDLFKQMGISARILGIDGPKAASMIALLGKNGKAFQGVLKDINNTGVNLITEEHIERIDQMLKLLESIKMTALAITATAIGKMLGGDFSDVRGIMGKVFTPKSGQAFFGLPISPAQAVMKTGQALAEATFPRADSVTHGALPVPTSAAGNAAQLKNDLEVIRIMKETKALHEKQVEFLRKLAGTSALGSF